ncbi:MAG TPA: hypothetical protein VK485_07820 [Sphingomicrobium sp.]|nr:hypothetical protein [Sphingomicrobium sp.]
MDSYRDHPSEYDAPASDAAQPEDVTASIGTDERRMHVRAYNHWASLLGGRDYPSIEDLDPASIEDFGPNSVLLDFTAGRDNPATPYIGAAIREECGLTADIQTISEVPSRSLLSRLTDHYLQIIANRAPIGFEAEFVNQRGENICYRGILMPFSSDDDTIDFIYGVINWKGVDVAPATSDAIVPMLPADPEPLELEAIADPEEATSPAAPAAHLVWEDGPLAEADDTIEAEVPEITLDPDAGLADRLWAARETAEAVKSADGRTRAALYRALGLAYDFAVAATREPQDYAELLEESGMKAQARAPMTPIAKLVFGIDYDKTRLTEFAAALSNAQRNAVPENGFLSFIESQPGGLKALVSAERQARRPEPRTDTRGEAAREALRNANTMSLASLTSSDEFVLVLARRSADGGYEPVATVNDAAMIDRAIRRSAS